MTACIGLLKWFVERYEKFDKALIQSIEGTIPYSNLQFAMDRCNEYVASKKHADIDKEFMRVWDHEWDQFLSSYYSVLHENGLFVEFSDPLATVYGMSEFPSTLFIKFKKRIIGLLALHFFFSSFCSIFSHQDFMCSICFLVS